MRLLYIGGSQPPSETLARLMLLGREICFLDRPSVTFGNWGTIGAQSAMRRFTTGSDTVKFAVFEPLSGPAQEFYQPYIEADLGNETFVRAFFEGLRSEANFPEKYIQPGANYGDGLTGEDVRAALLGDASLPDTRFSLETGDARSFYKIGTADGRLFTARSLLSEASIKVTNALLMADAHSAFPVSDDVTHSKLFSLRTSEAHYVGGASPLAPMLGLRFMQSVVPDEALKRMSFADIISYREKTDDIYSAWTNELEQAAEKIGDADLTKPMERIERIITRELQPKIKAYQDEMASARDKLLGDLVKGIAVWEVPALSIAYVTNLGMAGALAAFAAGARSLVPNLVDYAVARRDIRRRHAISYLMTLTKR